MNLNKSFLYGIFFASITWSISLYLYWQVTTANDLNTTLAPSSFKRYSNRNAILSNSVLDFESELKNPSNENYKNSNKLLKSLQSLSHKENHDVLNEIGLVKTVKEQQLHKDGYKMYSFNVLISDKLGYRRVVPDTRNKLCENVVYPADLPSASVIICFYNEHLTTLIRTLYSIVDRTPSYLLKEIILIDDYSDFEGLHSNLTNLIKNNDELKSHVKLVKTEQREGLIRARMFGARRAMGQVLVFLDSHIEVNVNWIQPLLSRIKQSNASVVTPVIDIINADTFRYTSSPLVRGGFNWGLHFKWENLPTGSLATGGDFVKPIKSPTMAGGLFAINRDYFTKMGEYDAGMEIWGGENLEISFRIWMCGGRIEIIPCSRVGHVFRQRRPYGDPNGKDTMLRNSLRVAQVWLDDYKDYFFMKQPAARNINYGDVSSRIQLRKELKCYDFDWYVKNVYPELTLPTDDDAKLKNKWSALVQDKYQPWQSRKRNYVDQYQLKLSNSSLCIQSKKDIKTKGSSLLLRNCLRTKAQIWYETDKSELVLSQLLCLQSGQASPYLYKCHEMGGNQEWKHKGQSNSPIYNIARGTCLGVDFAVPNAQIKMKLCTDDSLNKWDLVRS